MYIKKRLLIISIVLFCAFMHNVKAIYVSSSGTAYSGSVGSCGSSKNCYNNSNYFIVQARLYYVNNKSFTPIGKTYYFANTSGYNLLKNKGLNVIKITNFDGLTANNSSTNTNFVTAYNYIKNTYLTNASNRSSLLNGITETDDYDSYLNKDNGSNKGYRLMIEPVENYANPTFIDVDSSENSGLYTVKGLATEIMVINAKGGVHNDTIETNKNKELINGLQNKVQWLYQDTKDVGVSKETKASCEEKEIELVSDIKNGCGYRLINLNSYITTKKCYVQSNQVNGGLTCVKYDENNEKTYTPNFTETSCSGKSESEKLNILSKYGKLIEGTNSCGIYCQETVKVSYPGNVLNPVQQGSYFAWPTRDNDVTGKYKMSVNTKLTCYTVGTQTSEIGATFTRECPSGYEEWKGTIDGVYYDICRESNATDPICPKNYTLYDNNGTEVCRSTTETSKICPSGYSTEIQNTNYCTNNKYEEKECPSGYPNKGNNKCYAKCPDGYTFKNEKCRKTKSFKCTNNQETIDGKCYDKSNKVQTGTSYSCPSGTDRQTGSGTSLKCEKISGFTCGSRYQKMGDYCLNLSGKKCPSGYSYYPEFDKCLNCPFYKVDVNGKIYCGHYIYANNPWDIINCPMDYAGEHNGYCNKYIYTTEKSCSNSKGTFSRDSSRYKKYGLGDCLLKKDMSANNKYSNVPNLYPAGWEIAPVRYTTIKEGTKTITYKTLTRTETPIYGCKGDYPVATSDGKCRSKTGKNPSVCDGDVIDGVCYDKKDINTPNSTALVCPTGTTPYNGHCYYSKEKECDKSKTVEIGGKCYNVATKVCDYNVKIHKIYTPIKSTQKNPTKKDFADKVCPYDHNDYKVESDNRCYRYPKATDITTGNLVSAHEYTPAKDEYNLESSDAYCDSGWTEVADSSDQCKKFSKYYCDYDAGYELIGTSCRKFKGYYCNAGYEVYTDGETGNTYCWKWTDYWCDKGYGKWPSSGTCWSCNQTMYKSWGSGDGWEGPTNSTPNPDEAYYCGTWYYTAGNTNKCSKGQYAPKYGKCVYYSYNLTASLCKDNGGIDWYQNSQTTRNGTGVCVYSAGSASSVAGSWYYVEGGWVQGTDHWEWAKDEFLGYDYETIDAYEEYNYQSKSCKSGYPKLDGAKCYKSCGDNNYDYTSPGKCVRKTDKCVNKYNGVCYKACKDSSYKFNTSTGQCERKESCKKGTLQNHKCLKCDEGTLQSDGKCRIGKDKVCPKGYPTPVSDSNTAQCYKERTEENYCKKVTAYPSATNNYSFSFGSEGFTYVNSIDKCAKCEKGFLMPDGNCSIAIEVNLPNEISLTSGPPCYKTKPKETTWKCPVNYTLNGTKCINSCSNDTLKNAVTNKLKNSVSAKIIGGTNKKLDETLVASTPTITPKVNNYNITYDTTTTFKAAENSNRYYNKRTSAVANTTSGWNTKDIFDRKEGVISTSLNDPITTNGVVNKYTLQIKDSKFGLVEDYGKYITNYKCTYKLTTNSCKCPSGTDFAGVSLYDITGNICNLKDNNYTCAELQYRYCNKPNKYYCKNSSGTSVDITSCVVNKVNNGQKPYNAFIECRNATTTGCTKTCNNTCAGTCTETNETTGNVVLNIIKCDGKYCNLSPYCKTDGAIVSSSSLECMANKLDLESGQQLMNELNAGRISMTRLKASAKSCETTICGKQRIIFRTVDLSDPFYGNETRAVSGLSLTGNRARVPGSNWNSVSVVTIKILKGRDKEGNKIYNKDPLYTITLTPNDVKALRQYNKDHSYAEFNLKCNNEDKTYGCISEFIHGDVDSLKSLKIKVTGVSTCTSMNLTTNPENYKKCYELNN